MRAFRRGFQACPAPLAFLAAVTASAQTTFQGLGDLPGGSFSSLPTAISADGSTVVGVSNSQAFRWQSGTMTGLGFLPGGIIDSSTAQDVSADGSIVVGFSLAAAGVEAFRWDGAMAPLGPLPGGSGAGGANAVSDDGSIAAGSAENSLSVYEAFRWDGAMNGLGSPLQEAYAISADGLVIAGVEQPLAGFRWEGGSVTPVGAGVIPRGANGNGSVLVGQDATSEAFRWEAGVLTPIGTLPSAASSAARDVSEDGSIVAGVSGATPFLWDETNGMRDLEALLVALGVDLSGWNLDAAVGVSADGRTIAGTGTSANGTEGWIARLENAGGALVDARRIEGDVDFPGCGLDPDPARISAAPASPSFSVERDFAVQGPGTITAGQDSTVTAKSLSGSGFARQTASQSFCARSVFDVTFELEAPAPYSLTGSLAGNGATALTLTGDMGVVLAYSGPSQITESGDLPAGIYTLEVSAVSIDSGDTSWSFAFILDPSGAPSLSLAGRVLVAILLVHATLVASFHRPRGRRRRQRVDVR